MEGIETKVRNVACVHGPHPTSVLLARRCLLNAGRMGRHRYKTTDDGPKDVLCLESRVVAISNKSKRKASHENDAVGTESQSNIRFTFEVRIKYRCLHCFLVFSTILKLSLSKQVAASRMSIAEDIATLVRGGESDPETFSSLLDELEKKLDKKKIRTGDVAAMIKGLSVAERHFRSQKRKASDPNVWNTLLTRSQQFLTQAQEMKSTEGPSNEEEEEDSSPDNENCLPKNVANYLNRLKKDKKELYKNPPVLPPPKVVIEEKYVKEPTRDSKTGRLTFVAGKDASLAKVLKDFQPNQTPAEVLRGGGFGGTYFRTIRSSVNNKTYNGNEVLAETIPDEWIKGIDKKRMLTSATYKADINRYKVKCGGSLGMWEVSIRFGSVRMRV